MKKFLIVVGIILTVILLPSILLGGGIIMAISPKIGYGTMSITLGLIAIWRKNAFLGIVAIILAISAWG